MISYQMSFIIQRGNLFSNRLISTFIPQCDDYFNDITRTDCRARAGATFVVMEPGLDIFISCFLYQKVGKKTSILTSHSPSLHLRIIIFFPSNSPNSKYIYDKLVSYMGRQIQIQIKMSTSQAVQTDLVELFKWSQPGVQSQTKFLFQIQSLFLPSGEKMLDFHHSFFQSSLDHSDLLFMNAPDHCLDAVYHCALHFITACGNLHCTPLYCMLLLKGDPCIPADFRISWIYL